MRRSGFVSPEKNPVSCRYDAPRCCGMTLVELLVVIAIVAILMAILLPAVQATREAGRRTQCGNNVRQVAMAAVQHEASIGWLPAGGWGFGWVGDPDRGFDENQPGGFFYNCLPFMEHKPLHEMTAGLAGTEKRDKALAMAQVPIPLLTCPSRRSPRAYGVRASRSWLANTSRPADLANGWYRADYKVNGGDSVVMWGFGPASLAAGDAGSGFKDMANSNGVSHQQSRIPLAAVADGASMTYLVGEKPLNPDMYYSHGTYWADDEPALGADDLDVHGWTSLASKPERDTPGVNPNTKSFGSVHAASFCISFCDGSVRWMPYEIDPTVHRRLGNRRDGGVVDRVP